MTIELPKPTKVRFPILSVWPVIVPSKVRFMYTRADIEKAVNDAIEAAALRVEEDISPILRQNETSKLYIHQYNETVRKKADEIRGLKFPNVIETEG